MSGINDATTLAQAHQLVTKTQQEITQVVLGQDAVVQQVLVALLARGHVLLEGVPGLGKTLLVRALAKCFGGEFRRIQFTPDLMPSDVTGHALFNMQSQAFEIRKGQYLPICCWPTKSTAPRPKPRLPCWKSWKSNR